MYGHLAMEEIHCAITRAPAQHQDKLKSNVTFENEKLGVTHADWGAWGVMTRFASTAEASELSDAVQVGGDRLCILPRGALIGRGQL